MEAATTAENNAPSRKTGESPADSESHNVDEESSSDQIAEAGQADVIRSQEKDLNHMESEYHEAAARGKVDIFLDKKLGLDKLLTPKDNTILHIHITARPKSSPVDFVTKILEICPNLLKKANTEGETLLHMAAKYGHADIVQVLLNECKKPRRFNQENGTDSTCQMLGKINEAKDTALHEAVRYNKLDVVKILTAVGEDYKLSYNANSVEETPLYLAAERGYKDIVKNILKTCKSPAYSGPKGRTALHAAVICNDIDMTKWLLDKERSLTTQADEKGRVPLHYAAGFGFNEILESLVNRDKSVAYKLDNEGQTALHIAASCGNTKIMKRLISKCPDCTELVDKRGWNVLHFALHYGKRSAVKLVLQNPSLRNLINQKDDKGNTPLFQHASSPSFMSFFIDHPEVDKLAFNRQNQNVLDIILADNTCREKKLSLWSLESPQYQQRYCLVPKNEGGKRKSKRISVGRKRTDWKGKNKSDNMKDDDIKEAKETHLVVAALVATVTFTAGFTIPGGYDDNGKAVLSKNIAVQGSVISNTLALLLSGLIVTAHLYEANNRKRLLVRFIMENEQALLLGAMFSMMLSYFDGLVGTFGENRDGHGTLMAARLLILGMLVWALSIELLEAIRFLAPVRLRRTIYNFWIGFVGENTPLPCGFRRGSLGADSKW